MCHQLNFKHGCLHIDSPDWIKKGKATMNPKNEDDKCFQYAERIQKEFQTLNRL